MANDETQQIKLGQWRCDCHSKHSVQLAQIDKDAEKHEDEHTRVWDAMDTRVTNKYFLFLVLLVVGMLGFQWVNYDKLSAMDKTVTKEIAVIQTKLSSHMLKFYPDLKPYERK
jgi:hypothetical protein